MIKIALLIIMICAAVLAGTLPTPRSIYFIFEHSGYYFILLSFFLWVVWLIRLNHARIMSLVRRHYDGMLLSTLLMVLIFFMAPPKFKILNDETNLIGISMNMYQAKRASLPMQGFNLDYKTAEYRTTIDKRPLLFPLFVSIVHSLRGYSAYNGFVVNFMFGTLSLFVLHLFIYDSFSRLYGLLSIVILASLPNFVMWVTSSGFETVNLFFIMLAFYQLRKVLASKSIPQAELFFLTLLLLGQCRYESIIFTAGILFLLPMLLNKKSIAELSVVTFIIPFLYIPTIWLFRLYADLPIVNKVGNAVAQTPSFWESFSFENILTNSISNLNVFLGLDPHLGFSWVIAIISIAGIYLMIKRLVVNYHGTDPDVRILGFFGLVSLGLLYLTQVSFYLGNMALYTQNRFAMTYLPFIVVPAVYFVHAVTKKMQISAKVAVFAFFGFHLLFFWPYGSQQFIVHSGTIPYEYNKTLKYLDQNFNGNSNILIIAERPNLYVVHYKGSVSFAFANQYSERINKQYGKEYDEILVLQKYRYNESIPIKSHRLNPSYRLDGLQRLSLTRTEYLYISKLVLDR